MPNAEERALDFRIFRDVDTIETRYPAGAEILGPGKISGVMYVLKKGSVAVQVQGVTVEEIPEGGIFGEMGIVDPKPHSASVFAVEDCEVYVINQYQFLQLVGKTPTFALRVMRILARRLRAMNSRLPELEHASA